MDVALFGHKPDEGLGFVGVELIAHEDPFPLGVNTDGLLDVLGEIHLGAGITDGWIENLSRSHLKIGNERLCSVSNILKFSPFFDAGFNRFRWVESFQCLDAGHLIRTDDMGSLLMQGNSPSISFANRVYLSIETLVLFIFGIEPITGPVRLKVCFFLKSAPPIGARFCQRGCA